MFPISERLAKDIIIFNVMLIVGLITLGSDISALDVLKTYHIYFFLMIETKTFR
jgi:hypothetical protein